MIIDEGSYLLHTVGYRYVGYSIIIHKETDIACVKLRSSHVISISGPPSLPLTMSAAKILDIGEKII
jgi:hypothetical protein